MPAIASGGGYSGPLVYRNGEGMRPDVASAFDRMAAAAAGAGLSLVVNSGFRSDAEQAALFAAHPDPTWVAPPGHSLHRCATELDLGPETAYGWLAANAGRFGFVQRYSWEPWHYGYDAGPAPCSAAGDAVGPGGDGSVAGGGGPSGLRPRPLPGAAAARGGPLERLRGAARRAADGRVELRPVRRLSGGGAGHRPVHPLDRRRLRPRRPLRPGRSDRRRGPPDVGPDPPVRLAPARPRRLQRRPGSGRSLPLRPLDPRDRPPTSAASSACSAAPAPWRCRSSK